MNENLIVPVGSHLRCLLDQFLQFHTCAIVLLCLRVNHIDEGSTLGNLSLEVVLEDIGAWVIYHVEVDVVVGVDLLVVDLEGRCQEECLVRSKLLKHNFLNGSLARPIFTKSVSLGL